MSNSSYVKAGVMAAMLALCGCQRSGTPPAAPPSGAVETGTARITARLYQSGFPQSHDSYNGMLAASDGKIYYALSTDAVDTGAHMYSFDPAGGKITLLGEMNEACGEGGKKFLPQAKVHVNFVEHAGKLYFATHMGYYTVINGMERPGIPPAGYKKYPGGHFLSYDMASGKFEGLATAPAGEGIITFAMDARRGRAYGITWPKGRFLRLDLAKKDLKDLGPVALDGENGEGPRYQTICRSLAVDPEDGSVYFTSADGAILRYRYDRDAIETVHGEDLRKDYFGQYDTNTPGHMGYHWRQTVWYAPERAIYGVHGNSGYLFRFDPSRPDVVVLGRLTSAPSQRSGMSDQFSYGYLGLTLGPDSRTLYRLTGGPVYLNGRRLGSKEKTSKGESKGEEDLHLITYDIPSGKYIDHGAIYFADGRRPTYVNSIAIGRDGTTYCLARVVDENKTRCDLVSIPAPKL